MPCRIHYICLSLLLFCIAASCRSLQNAEKNAEKQLRMEPATSGERSTPEQPGTRDPESTPVHPAEKQLRMDASTSGERSTPEQHGTRDSESTPVLLSEESPPPVFQPWRITIGATGDLLVHQGVKDTAAHQAANPDEPGDDRFDGWWYVFKEIAPLVQNTDVSLLNLEAPLAEERHTTTRFTTVMNGPPVLAAAVKAVGFDMVNLANNHMFDQERAGVAETIDAINMAGLPFVGAGLDKSAAAEPTMVTVKGATIAFFGWTYNSNRYPNNAKKKEPWVMHWDAEQAASAVRAVRDEADLVIASVHFDADFRPIVQTHQKSIARTLCDAGVDMIVGTGPHVLHPVEWVANKSTDRRCLAAYSLGNFVSNHGLKYRQRDRTDERDRSKKAMPASRDGLFLRVTFENSQKAPTVTSVDGVALWTENNWLERFKKASTFSHRISITPIEAALLSNPPHPIMLRERLATIKRTVGDTVRFSSE